MMASNDIPPAVQDALTRLARTADRAAPAVFAGREDEFRVLDDAIWGAAQGEPGHTVVIQGVPGAGKTAMLNEYAGRLLAAPDDGRPIIPVPLMPRHFKGSALAIVHEIDQGFRDFEASNVWKRRANPAVDGASTLGNALFAALTKKSFGDFRISSRLPDSLSVALREYVSFRFDRRHSTVALLVDESQNLSDTPQVRDHLETLHGGVKGPTNVLLACFGLANTRERLRQLGLSRMASDHVRTLGPLSDEEAKRTVTGTLDIALADYAFDKTTRQQWIGEAAATILEESGNFPHHLANGCRALGRILLREGIAATPPVEKLREQCRGYKRDYYNERLHPWAEHSVALAHAFADANEQGWTSGARLRSALMASDDHGDAVDPEVASRMARELCDSGFLENQGGAYRPALPSLRSHLAEMRRAVSPDNEVLRAVEATTRDGEAR